MFVRDFRSSQNRQNFYISLMIVFSRPKNEIYEFCEMYKEFKIPFWFNTRPENCKSEYLEALREAGTYRISFGVECGNQDFRQKVLLRKPSNEELLNSFEIILIRSCIQY